MGILIGSFEDGTRKEEVGVEHEWEQHEGRQAEWQRT
jgi:hypothetical protein